MVETKVFCPGKLEVFSVTHPEKFSGNTIFEEVEEVKQNKRKCPKLLNCIIITSSNISPKLTEKIKNFHEKKKKINFMEDLDFLSL